MNLQLLIAVPDEEQRHLLGIIYTASPLVASIEYVSSCKDLYAKLEQTELYFVVVHRSFVTDISLLPKDRFVLLAEEMDKDMFIAVTDHGGHYFLDNPLPVAMLQAALDPAGTFQKPMFRAKPTSPSVKEILTPCQLSVFELREKGLTYKEIAEKLSLSFHTAKKHLEDARKRLREHGLL